MPRRFLTLLALLFCGAGFASGDLALTPATSSISLLAGDVATAELTLSNAGASSENWTATVPDGGGLGGGGLESVLAAFDAEHASISALVPNQYLFRDGITGTFISDGGTDMYDNGNTLNTDLGTSIPYSDGVVTTSAAVGPTGQYFTRKQDGLFLFAANLDGADRFQITGNLGADGGGLVGSSEFVISRLGTIYRCYFKKVYNAGDASINHLIITADRPGLTRTHRPVTNDESHTVNGLAPSARLYYLLFASASGGEVSDAQAQVIATQLLSSVATLGNLASVEDPTSGQLLASSDTILSVQIDAADFSAGTFPVTIQATSAGAAATAQINVTVEDAPGLVVLDTDPFDLGEVFVGIGRGERVLTIYNKGSRSLTLSDLITTGASFDTPEPIDLTIPPNGSLDLLVQSVPPGLGLATGSLHFSTNDPTHPTFSIALNATGVTAPITIDPPAPLQLSLAAGDRMTLPLSLTNNSLEALDFTLETDVPPLEDVLAALGDSADEIIAALPGFYPFSGGDDGSTNISDGGNDMYDNGNRLFTNLNVLPMPYTQGNIQTAPVVGANGRYFTHKSEGLFVFAADLDGATQFEISGGVGDNEAGGMVETMRFVRPRGAKNFTVFLKRNFGESSPSVNHLIIVEGTPPDLVQNADPFSANDLHTISGLSGTNRLYYLLFSLPSGGRIDDATVGALLDGFLDATTARIAGVADAASGTIPAGGSSTVDLVVDSSGLTEGSYSDTVGLSWNGASAAAVDIAVQLEVTPAPGARFVDAEDSSLERIFAGIQNTTRTFTFTNSGNLPLQVFTMGLMGEGFTLLSGPTPPFALAPGESVDFDVAFESDTPGTFDGELTILSNDPTDPILSQPLSATAIAPPLAITPGAIDLQVTSGEQQQIDLSLANTSGGPVDVSISGPAQPSLEEILTNFTQHSAALGALIADRRGITGLGFSSISDGPSDMYDEGSILSTDLSFFGNRLRYTSNLTNAADTGPEGNHLSTISNGVLMLAADLDGVSRFQIDGTIGVGTGSTIANSTGQVEGARFDFRIGHNNYTAFFKSNFNGGNRPSVNHLIILENPEPDAAHSFPKSITSDLHVITGLAAKQRIYYLLFATNLGGRVSDDAALAIATDFAANVTTPRLVDLVTFDNIIFPADFVAETQVSIDASLIPPGVYDGGYTLTWDVAGDTLSVPFAFNVEVLDAPRLVFDSDTPISFDPAYAELTSSTASVSVANHGSAALSVVASFDHPAFSTPAANFTLVPGETKQLPMVFAPQSLGAVMASLTLTTNDPNTPTASVDLSGTGLASPLSINPHPVAARLNAGDVATTTVSLTNTSGASVDWEFQTPAEPALAEVLAAFDATHRGIADAIPGRVQFRGGLMGTSINNDENLVSAGGLANLPMPYSDGQITPYDEAPVDYFTRRQPGLFLLAADLTGVDSFRITGSGSGGGFLAQNTGAVLSFQHLGQDYTAFVMNGPAGSGPSEHHLVIVPNAPPAASHTFSMPATSEEHQITGLNGTTRLYYLRYYTEEPIPDSLAETIARQFLQSAHPARVAYAGQSGGTLGAGESADIDLVIDATHQDAGIQRRTPTLRWDEGGGAVTTLLPIEVTIDDAPSLLVASDPLLVFPATAIGEFVELSFPVTNNGSLPVSISSATPSDAQFNVTLSAAPIKPGQTVQIPVSFTPTSRGLQSATVALISDDPSAGEVTLEGTGTTPPQLGTLPANIALSVPAGTATASFTVPLNNVGDGVLGIESMSPSLLPVGNLSLAAAADRLESIAPNLIARLPELYPFSGGVTGNELAAEPGSPFAGANRIRARSASFDNYIDAADFGVGPLSTHFTRKFPGFFVHATDVSSGSSLVVEGTLAAAGPGRTVDTAQLSFDYGGSTYHGFVKRVFGGGIPSVHHLIVTHDAPGLVQTVDTGDPQNDGHSVGAFPTSRRAYFVMFSTADGSRVDDAGMQELLVDFARAFTSPAITLSPNPIEIPTDGSVDLQVSVDVASLPAGTYDWELELLTNIGQGHLIPLRIEITPTGLGATPTTLRLVTVEGVGVSKDISLRSHEAAELSWTATTNVPWLQITDAGTTPAEFSVSVNPALLPTAGRSDATIAFIAGGEKRLAFVSTTNYLATIDQLLTDPNRPAIYGIRRGDGIEGSGVLITIDSLNAERTATVPIASEINAVCLHPEDDAIYLKDVAEPTSLVRYDLATGEQTPLEVSIADLTHLSPGPAGRLVGEDSSGTLYLFDSASGEIVGVFNGIAPAKRTAATTFGPPSHYRVVPSGGQFVVERRTPNAVDLPSRLSAPYFGIAQDPLVVSARGSRIFWGSSVFDQSLSYLGDLGDIVHSSSPGGELAITRTNIRRLSSGGGNIGNLPFPTELSTVLGDAERLFLYDNFSRTGSIIALRQATLSPAMTDFGPTPLGTQSSAELLVMNDGIEDLTLTGFTTSEPGFTVASALPITIAPGGSANLSLSYSPQAEGPANTEITLHSTFIETPTFSITAAGEGTFDPDTIPGYAAWRAANFAQDPALGDPLADPDGDGLQNLAEYLFVLDPLADGDPSKHLPTISDGQLTFVRAAIAADHIAVEQTTDLGIWSDAILPEGELSDLGNGAERVSYPLPEDAGRVLFYRAAGMLQLAP